MTDRRARVRAAAVLSFGAVLAILAADAWNPGVAPAIVAADIAVGWAFIGGGLVAWTARPGSVAGRLMVAAGAAWLAGTIWPALELLHRGLVVHLLATSPTGRLVARPTTARAWARLGAVLASYMASLTGLGGSVAGVVFGGALAIVAIDAFLPGRGLGWRSRWTEGVLAGAIAVVVIVGQVARAVGSPLPGSIFLYDAVLAAAAVILAADLVAGRRAAELLSHVVVDLGDTSQAGTVRDRLAGAIGDPSLVLAFAVDDVEGAWADEAGAPVPKPIPGDARSLTPIVVDGREVGFIAHDPAVLNDPRSVAAISAAAELAISNSTMQAEVRRRVADVEASRERLVRAGDVQRRRLEERLQTGTLARLQHVAERLGQVRPGGDDAARDLAGLRDEVERARRELADFARGVHPSALVAGGLPAALAELAARSPVPVTLTIDVGRTDALTESTCYFVCSEGVTNAIKHGSANHIAVDIRTRDRAIVLSVSDDGTGGARLGARGGLRGLADRVEALGGTLVVESPNGGGTRIVARLPERRAGEAADRAPFAADLQSATP